jgi:hypothetical protein
MVSIRYRTITVKVSGEKPKTCSCCNKEVKPRGLHAHHIRYAYTVDEVRKNHELAKENTIWLCYKFHRIANSYRIIEEHPKEIARIKQLIEESKNEKNL